MKDRVVRAVFAAAMMFAGSAVAEVCSYTDGEWSPNAPTSEDSVKMVSGDLEWKSPLPMSVKGWTQPETYAGTVTFDTGLETFTVDGDVNLQGGTWTHTANPSLASSSEGWKSGRGTKQLIVAVTGQMTIGAKAAVHGDEKGFIKSQGPGKGVGGASQGSAHGASGDDDNKSRGVYGSLFHPNTIGSGSSTHSGGGAISISVTKSLALDGRVSANAHPYNQWGCAAGGSVYISAGSLSGSGSIEANAEAYYGGRYGGGGRIAVYLADANADFTSFTGKMSAYGSRKYDTTTGTYGSTGASPSGPIYLEKASDGPRHGELRLLNGSTTPSRGFYTMLPAEEGPYHFSKITIGAGTQLTIPTGLSVTADELEGASVAQSFLVLRGGTLVLPRDYSVENLTLGVYGGTASQLKFAEGAGTKTLTVQSGGVMTCDFPLTVGGSIVVKNGGKIEHSRNCVLGYKDANMVRMNLTVDGDFAVESGGSVTAFGAGYDYSITAGPGSSDTTTSNGSGSYGGLAKGAPDTKVYGSIREPTDFGSTGHWSSNPNKNFSGGGAIKVVVSGTATVDGQVNADGRGLCSHVSGSGAGGSIWFVCKKLLGSGHFSADGGAHNYNASVMGGSGGRIAITLTDPTADFTAFTGKITATGGHSTNDNNVKNYSKVAGAAGTIYLRTGAQGPEEGSLIITNGLIAASAVTQETVIGPNVTDTRVGRVSVGTNGRLRIAANATLGVAGDVEYVTAGSFATTDSPDGGITPGATLAFFDSSCVGRLLGVYSLANLSVTEPGKEVQFDAAAADGVVIRSGGSLTLDGTEDNLVKLRSTVDGTQARLELQQGVRANVSFADVKDSNAVGLPIAAKDSVNSGNNSDNWQFPKKIVPGEELLWTGGAGNSDWGDLGNWDRGRPPEPTDFIRIGCTGDEVTHWPSLPVDTQVGKLEVAAGAQLTLAGRSLTVTNGCAVAGTLAVNGGELLTLSGDISLAAIAGGTVDLTIAGSGDQAVSLGDNAFGTVQFDKDSGTVSFADGVSCRKFLQSGTAALTFAFAAGTALAADEVRLACADGDAAKLTLVSGTASQAWNINVRNLALVSGVVVSDSHATGKAIYADAPSVDAGRNEKWYFGSRSVTWVGGASGVFTDAANWSDGKPLDANTRVILDQTATYTIPAEETPRVREVLASAGTATFSGAGELDVVSMFVIEDGATVVMNVPLHVEDYAEVGGVLTHTASPSAAVTNRLFVTVDGDFTVSKNGKVTAAGKGLNKSMSISHPSRHDWNSSHGGIGGVSTCYGSVFQPVAHGVGTREDNNGRGGGVLRLVVGGTLAVEGTVDANGQYVANFPPPGGSVWITCGTLAGGGKVSANGGDYYDHTYVAGAAGGRVAVYETTARDFSAFTGVVSAYGGSWFVDGVYYGTPYSGCGTVYLESANDGHLGGTILLDNAKGSTNGAQLPAAYEGDDPASFRNAKIVLRNNGALKLSQDLRVADLEVTTGTASFNLNDHILKVSSMEHRNGLGWRGETNKKKAKAYVDSVCVKGTKGQGEIVWPKPGLMLFVR